MGLDANGYQTATVTEAHERTDDCWEADHVRAYVLSPSFHQSLRGLISDRCYVVAGTEVHVQNSYGGHGIFRRRLAEVFLGVSPETVWDSPDDFRERPFFELIHFADNEGTIGPEAAADLAEDFRQGADRWATEAAGDDWLTSKYAQWSDAFATAASGGLVWFA